MASAAPVPSRWLFGPARDLLLGCGLLYAMVFVAFAVGSSAGWTAPLHGLGPLLLPLVALPHYGATLLRVYEQRADRRRYTLFAVYVTLFLVAAFVLGLYDVLVGSLLLTLYSTWGPWHYSGQNYGLAVMFLRRRGVDVSPHIKRLLYASFLLSYAFVVLVFHSARGKGGILYGLGSENAGAIRFLPLGIPATITDLAFPVIAGAYLVCLVACARGLLRNGSPRDLLPAATLVFTQALWFTIPYGISYWGAPTGIDPIDRHLDIGDYIVWVALGHGAQYLWVTTYYARGSRGWHGTGGYLAKTLLAGVAVWTLPVFLFAPDLLGPRSYAGGVALLAAAVVNLHHFVLDGAIWKLRDGRIARVLLGSREDAASGSPSRSWVRPLVWTACGAWLFVQVLGGVVYRYGAMPAMDPLDVDKLNASARLLRWIGQDTAEIHFRLGVAAGERGDLPAARAEFERMLDIQESARAWIGLAFVAVHSGDPEAARAGLVRAVQAEPSSPEAWARAADVWLALGDPARARASIDRAIELAPDRSDLRTRSAVLEAQEAERLGTVAPSG